MVDTRFSVSVQIMVTLAYHQAELLNSEVLAKVLKTNPTFIRKLVARLVEAKLVKSQRGKNGGITLGRLPSEINLKDIYCAMMEEKCLVSVHKKPVAKSCVVSCSMDNILENIVTGVESSTKSYLARITLHDLLKKI